MSYQPSWTLLPSQLDAGTNLSGYCNLSLKIRSCPGSLGLDTGLRLYYRVCVIMIPTISTIPLLQLASGDRLGLQVYRFQGADPGKKAYIQSNLHGAEISGNEVIHHLIGFLSHLDPSQLVGEIWLVPVCNPLGVNQIGRAHV